MSVGAALRSAVAVLVTAAAVGLAVLGAVAPAQAAACAGTSGVTVVVEFGALGGGTDVDCSPEGGGHTADRLLKDAGHALTYVQRFPGFVCRIDGTPADDPCVNTPPGDAYWGLWWSDGTNGKWSYSSLGAGSLSIPAGGYVAMVWDGASGEVRPRTDPDQETHPPDTHGDACAVAHLRRHVGGADGRTLVDPVEDQAAQADQDVVTDGDARAVRCSHAASSRRADRSSD